MTGIGFEGYSSFIGSCGGGIDPDACVGDCLEGEGSWLLEDRILAKDIGLLVRSGFCGIC